MSQESTKTLGYGSVIGHIARDLGHVVQHELELVRAESREILPRVARHTTMLGISVLVLSVSVLPLVVFLIIGLGRLLGDNYWLSSLIVGVIGVVAGGATAMSALRQLKSSDFGLPRSRKSIQESTATILNKVKELKTPEVPLGEDQLNVNERSVV